MQQRNKYQSEFEPKNFLHILPAAVRYGRPQSPTGPSIRNSVDFKYVDSDRHHAAVDILPEHEFPCVMYDMWRSPGSPFEQQTRTFMESRFGHDFTTVGAQTRQVTILPQQVGIRSGDPIHDPLIEEYRSTTGQPQGGVDESGQQVGPSDAELKYSGILGGLGRVRWLAPVINRRNFAEVQFRSTGLTGTAGLTTQFLNEQEIHSNQDVETAIPRPPVNSRTEGGTTRCWFSHGVDVTGRTTMDIFTRGPWNFTAPRAEVAARYSWDTRCQGNTGPATIHIDARPNDAAMEEFVRLGEAEHDDDTHRAFNNNIAAYAANVNRLVGDTPTTRVIGSDIRTCQGNLRQLENRDLLTQFVVDLNSATARRHSGGRHAIARSGISVNGDCSRIDEEMDAGRL
jgi:hypothetical protein